MRAVLRRWAALTRLDWAVVAAAWAVIAGAHFFDKSFVWRAGWEGLLSVYILVRVAYALLVLRLAIAALEPEDPHALAAPRYLAAVLLSALVVALTHLVLPPSEILFGKEGPRLDDFYQGFFPALLDGALLTMLYVAMRRSLAARRALAEAERVHAADAAQLAELRLLQREGHVDSAALVAELRRIEALYEADAPAADARVDELVDRLRASLPATRAAA